MRPRKLDLVRLAECHFAVTYGEPPEGRVALAWLTRNLMERAGLSVEDVCTDLLDLGVLPSPLEQRFMERIHWSGLRASVSLITDVWDNKVPDPTGGAVRAHRHDLNPLWADELWPTTLVGSWIFYKAGG